jgi:hypothetical protein
MREDKRHCLPQGGEGYRHKRICIVVARSANRKKDETYGHTDPFVS